MIDGPGPGSAAARTALGSPLVGPDSASGDTGAGDTAPAETAPGAHPRVALRVGGMTCASCAATIERALARQPGVVDARVRYADGSARVRWDPETADLDALLAPVRALGFRVARDDPAARRREDAEETSTAWSVARLGVSAFFAMDTMLVALLVYLGEIPPGEPTRIALVATGILSTPVVFFGGWPFLRRAAASLRHGAPGMDLLVALGALSAWGLSVANLALGEAEAWFDTAAMIVLFLLVGRHLERRARHAGVSAVERLVALAPDLARAVDPETGTTVYRAADTLAPGDRYRLRAGDRAPVDGRVRSGTSTLDRSPLTGESVPAAVGPGDEVEAGCLNLSGALELEVVNPVGERTLDRVARAVDRLLDARAPLEALADRIARRFVVAVLAIATITLGLALASGVDPSAAALRTIAVVVIACPCALGLATPLALVVAAGAGARLGILYRDGGALERAARIDAVAFDKTGTLTAGLPDVVATLPAPGVDPSTLLSMAATLEAESRHPFAGAIRRAAPDAPAVLPGWPPEVLRREGFGGLAVAAPDGALLAAVGSAPWLACLGRPVAADAGRAREDAVPHAEAGPPGDGRSRVHVVVGDRWLGAIDLADTLRPDARAAVDALRADGMPLALWTGDGEGPARAVAGALALDARSVAARLDPEAKAARVTAWRAEGHRVAFVGDGTNDAPALAAADLGVAVDRATDVALETADVVVRAGGLARVVDALHLARRTRRVMLRNFVWAVGYNALALPAAVAGWVPPAAAALAMAASSVSVALSSLSLARTRPDGPGPARPLSAPRAAAPAPRPGPAA